MSKPTTRRLTALALTLAAAGGVAAVPEPAHALAPRAHAGEWVGSVFGRFQRSTRFGSAGTAMRGDFTLHVTRKGTVSGFATVSYEPNFNTDGLNNLLDFAKQAAGNILALVPVFGGFGSSALQKYIGVRIRFDDLLPIRTGAVTGTVDGSRVELRWAGSQKGVPFTAFLGTLKSDRKLTSGRVRIQDPFGATGAVKSGSLIVGTTRRNQFTDGGREQSAAYWSARRVG